MRQMLTGLAAIAAALLHAEGTVLAASPPLAAQGQAAPSSNASVMAYEQGVRSEEAEQNLDIRRMAVRVEVRGLLAMTEIELQVHARGSQNVEGHVRVALPQGAVVTGYALDVAGEMVDGSLVEASRAKAAYERQVRGQIDPGLAEVDRTGVFTTRVFPIDRAAGRRLLLRFVAPVGGGYRLPLDLPAMTDGWSVSVTGDPVEARLGGHRLPRQGDGASRSGRQPVGGDLVLAAARTPDAVASRHATGERYWQLGGPLPRADVRTGGTLRIYWDRSRSRRDVDHAGELARVREAIRALQPRRIEWVAFSSGEPERATVSSFAEVEQRVRALRYVGATSYAALAGDEPADTCLLVSDGQVTLDEDSIAPPPCRLFAIASAAGSNIARLSALAQASGGRMIAVGEAAADWRAPSVERVIDAGGRALPFLVLPTAPGRWAVAVAAPASGPVRVIAGGDTFARDASMVDAPPFDGEGALLAAARLAGMEGTGDRAAFVALSRRYSVASPTLSFVVLEQPEDYVRNNILPPAGYRRHKEFAELRFAAEANRKAAEENRFGQLLEDWQEQVAWYDKRFDLTARPPRDRVKGLDDAVPPPAVMSVPAPPPIASAPPAALGAEFAADVDASGSGDVIVTSVRRVGPDAQPDVAGSVEAWRPDRDYLDAFDKAPAAFDSLFAEWERRAGGVPAFYLDTADWLHRRGRRTDAVPVLLSALDLPTADQVTLGMVAARLERYEAFDLAVQLRERQAALDPDRPQPRRLLALALARRASTGGAGAKADLERAVALLLEIALAPVDDRWDGVDMIALVEANALLVRLRALGGDVAMDPRLRRNLASDVRIVIDWSSDASDVDLWVDEPNGERGFYGNPRTMIGGTVSNDMTQGFGPEEYRIRRAAPGAYVVRANVFAPDRLDPNGAARVTAWLYRDWGRPTERVEAIDFDIRFEDDGPRDDVRIGTLTVEAPGER